MWGKYHVWNLSTCAGEADKYLNIIVGDSVVKCDEIIEMAETVPTKAISINFNKKR